MLIVSWAGLSKDLISPRSCNIHQYRCENPFINSFASFSVVCRLKIGIFIILTLVMLNKLRFHTHSSFSANQFTWSGLLIQIKLLNCKQCRSQLIWIYSAEANWSWEATWSRSTLFADAGHIRVQQDQDYIQSLLKCMTNFGASSLS